MLPKSNYFFIREKCVQQAERELLRDKVEWEYGQKRAGEAHSIKKRENSKRKLNRKEKKTIIHRVFEVDHKCI